MPRDDLHTCVDALVAAHERLRGVLRGGADHFAQLGEWLWWQVIVDDLREDREDGYQAVRDRDRPEIVGLRHARNVVAHGTDPTHVSRRGTPGGLPTALPFAFSSRTPYWRPFDDLPDLTRRSDRLEGAYRDHLAERSIRPIVDDVTAYHTGREVHGNDAGTP